MIDASEPEAPARAATWLRDAAQTLWRRPWRSASAAPASEAPGIYARARSLIAAMLDRVT